MKYFFIIITGLILIFGCRTGSEEKKLSEKLVHDTIHELISIEEISKQIRKTPENPELFVKRAELQFKNANLDEAINDIKIALVLDSLNTDYHIILAEYRLNKGHSGPARDALIKALEIDPFNVEARIKLAQIYFYVEMYNQALREIANLEENRIDNADSHFLKALIFLEQNKMPDAIRSFRKTIDFDRNFWQAYNYLGLIYNDRNDPIAVEYFRTAINLFPENLEIRLNAGIVFQDFNRAEEAIEQYEYILSVDTTVYNAQFNKGYVYLELLKDYQKAIEAFTKAIELDRTSYPAFYNKGYAYEILGDLDRAEFNYRKALEIRPNYDPAVDGLNDVIEKRRQKRS